MKPNLYIVQNIMIFLEECLVAEPRNNMDYFCLNTFYVRNTETYKNLVNDIKKIYNIHLITMDELDIINFDKVLISSYLQLENQPIVDNIHCNKIMLVEDGTYDYLDISTNDSYGFYDNKELYLFKPEIASESANRAKIFKIKPNQEIINKFIAIYKDDLIELSGLDNKTPILFTTPLEEDFGASESVVSDILENLHKRYGISKLILKRHPRDHFEYKSDNVDIVECKQNIPGQIIDNMFNGLKLYLYTSTVGFMSKDIKNMIFVNALPNSIKYQISCSDALKCWRSFEYNVA